MQCLYQKPFEVRITESIGRKAEHQVGFKPTTIQFSDGRANPQTAVL